MKTMTTPDTTDAKRHADRAMVLSVARSIDPNDEQVIRWFNEDLIAEFGHRTARQMVQEGCTASLLAMMYAIRDGLRGV